MSLSGSRAPFRPSWRSYDGPCFWRRCLKLCRGLRLGRNLGAVFRHLPGHPGPRRVGHQLSGPVPDMELTTDMLWLDNETAGSSVSAVASCAADFMKELSALRPHNPRGVYSFYDFVTAGNCAGLSDYPLWLA